MINQLLLMAKAPVPGLVKTRLVPPLTPDEAAALHAAMLADTVTVLQHVSVDKIHAAVMPATFNRALLPSSWNIFPQVAGDLGARLAAAFRHVMGQGASRVVAVGVDSPTLQPSSLQAAFAALARADVVLGPAEDGGCYAIGLRQLSAAFFEGVTWGTASVCDQLIARANCRCQIALEIIWRFVAPFCDIRMN